MGTARPLVVTVGLCYGHCMGTQLLGCASCGRVNVVTIEPGQDPSTVAVKDSRASVARFFAARGLIGSGLRVRSGDLLAAYMEWCGEAGTAPLAPQTFGRAVVELMGAERYRSNGERFYLNVALRD